MKRSCRFPVLPRAAALLFEALCLALLLGLRAALPIPAVAAGAPRAVPVPVIMYHALLRDPARHGRYIVSPDVLREDLTYLTAHGYESVFASDLIAFVQDGAPLPDKPVLITFDDGHYNNLTYALPLLEELGHKAVVAVVGAYCDRYTAEPDPNPNYAYLSWDEVRVLSDSGVFEIAGHSYDLHSEGARKGAGKKQGESTAAYEAMLRADTERLLLRMQECAGLAPQAYAYPFGVIASESAAVLQDLGIRCTFSCLERVSVLTSGAPDSLLALGRFNRPAGISTEDFMRRALGNADAGK